MTTEAEIEFERERIRKLVTSLGNVMETIRGTSTEVGSAAAKLKEAHVALEGAKADFVKSSSKVVIAVVGAVDGLPVSISKKLLEELDDAISTTITNSVQRLNLASGNASAAAKTLQDAITANWSASNRSAIVSGAVAGAVASVVVCIVAGLFAYLLRSGQH